MKELIISDEFKKPEFFFIARLPILTGSHEILLLRLSDLSYIEADGSYSKIYTHINPNVYVTSKNIGHYERILPNHSFCRIHNKFIVNINQINYLRRHNHWSIELLDKSVLKISDDKRNELLKRLGLINDS